MIASETFEEPPHLVLILCSEMLAKVMYLGLLEQLVFSIIKAHTPDRVEF